MKWGTAFRLALKAFLFGMLWFAAGVLILAGAAFLFLSGIRVLALFSGFTGLFLMFFGFFAAIFKVGDDIFTRTSIEPVEITYEKEGFASILGQLLEQNLSENPQKVEKAREMEGSIVIQVRDMDTSATVEFGKNRITVYNGTPVKGKFAMISADFETINALSTGKAGMLKTLVWILKGKLKIKGIRMARKFQSLLS